jgi:cysteine sulfinate desulfinase/cysteine desulfurase-like protein
LEKVNTSIRLGVSKFTTKKEIDYTIGILKKVVEKLRRMSPIK